jgi:hypothetical protein
MGSSSKVTPTHNSHNPLPPPPPLFLASSRFAPPPRSVSLMGDFNGWSRDSHPCTMDAFGVWSLDLPDKQGVPALAHESR